MSIIRSFLLFLLLSTQVQADTIYSLIKIPNLKIYEINTINKLRYLYATKPFRLGVNLKKNIQCLSSDKKTLDRKFKIINKNLNRYSLQFLKKINLKYIVLCENLSVAKINTAGIPNKLTRTLIIDIKFNENFFERAIHHEVFHMINDSHKYLFNKEEWKTFNKKDFKYSKCSTCNNGWNLDLYDKTDGFLTEYSKSTASEDMAEIFSHLMFYKNKTYINDLIIEKKIQFIQNSILKIDNTFAF
jgi:hypothetical protein